MALILIYPQLFNTFPRERFLEHVATKSRDSNTANDKSGNININ